MATTADRDRSAAHLDDLTPAAALTIMAESLSERGDWTGGSLADVNDPRWAETVMGGLSTPRRTLMAGFPEFTGMGHGRIFGVVSVTGCS